MSRECIWAATIGLGILLVEPAYPADDQTSEQSDVSSADAAADTPTLLRKVEDQVLRGQMLSPPDDNAFQTWERVLARVSTGSPDQLTALAAFLVHVRQRVLSEQAAGNISRSVELMLFADQAERILGADSPKTTPEPEVAQDSPQPAQQPQTTPPPASAQDEAVRAEAPPEPASADAQPEPEHAEAPPEPSHAEAPPEPSHAEAPPEPSHAEAPPEPSHAEAPPEPVRAEAPPPPPTVVATRQQPSIAPEMEAAITPRRSAEGAQRPQDPAAAALYTSKGDALLAIRDISAARKFYEYGANAGGARAALALARTYDPTYIPRLGAVGLASDPAMAETWYRRAAELGEPDAQVALEKLRADSGK